LYGDLLDTQCFLESFFATQTTPAAETGTTTTSPPSVYEVVRSSHHIEFREFLLTIKMSKSGDKGRGKMNPTINYGFADPGGRGLDVPRIIDSFKFIERTLIKKGEFFITNYSPLAQFWLEAWEHNRTVDDLHERNTKLWADFVIIMSPSNIIMARPIRNELDPNGEKHLTVICETARRELDWGDPNTPILFRVFTPYKESIKDLKDLEDLKDPNIETTDRSPYMFTTRPDTWETHFKDYFGDIARQHENKFFNLSGYFAFRGDDMRFSSRIVVKDLNRARNNEFKDFTGYSLDEKADIRLGFPLIMVSEWHRNTAPNLPVSLIPVPYEGCVFVETEALLGNYPKVIL
jgi:hypothetical protein